VRFGDLGSNHCQQPGDLCRVDAVVRVAEPVLEGVTN
jgi:hypothetical protein